MSGSITTPSTKTDTINAYGKVVVSIVVLILFGAVTTLVLTHTIPSSESATMVVGSVLTMAGAVVSFWIGSSSGSQSKDEKIAAQLPPPAPPTPPAGSTTVTATPGKTTVTTDEGTRTTTTAAPPIVVNTGTTEPTAPIVITPGTVSTSGTVTP